MQHTVQQSLVEFCAVATRPLAANGLGLVVADARAKLDEVKLLFPMLSEKPLHAEWENLVQRYSVSGKSVHDTRLVAAMRVHGVSEILTFNGPDFARYTEIQVLDPAQIA